MHIRSSATVFALVLGFLATVFLPSYAADQGKIAVTGGDSPKGWFKGHVLTVSPDGKSLTGRCATEKRCCEWAWNPASGFAFGKTLPDGTWTENPDAPKAQLDAWDKQYGWSEGASDRFPGKYIGSHIALGLWAESESKDGSVVVGGYDCGNESNEMIGESQGEEDLLGRRYTDNIRSFVWVKDRGYFDLWDFAAKTRDVAPKTETYNISSAVSEDGKAIAVFTDRLYLIKVPDGFIFPSTILKNVPRTAGRTVPKSAVRTVPKSTGIRLSGVIQTVDTDGFTMLVDSVQTPDGKTVTLSPPRPKKVLVKDFKPDDWVVGMLPIVEGTDSGPGTPIKASSIILR